MTKHALYRSGQVLVYLGLANALLQASTLR